MMKNNLKAYARFIQVYFHYCLWIAGIKKSGADDQSRLISLYCQTQGKGTSALYKMTAWSRSRPRPVAGLPGDGIAGGSELQAVTNLEKNGLFIIPSRLPKSSLREIYEFALKTPAVPRPARETNEKVIINLEKPEDSAYHFSQKEIVSLPSVQRILADPSLLRIASGYLRTQPTITGVAMWWSTPHQAQKNQDELAQRFHFDFDMLKWVKLFIYINDVSSENGAHSFVQGTHRPGALPQIILEKGYQRLSDEEVQNQCGIDNIKTMEGPAGTIFFEDTVGLHKGKNPRSGNRLVLQVEFSGSDYGSPSKPCTVLGSNDCATFFKEKINTDPAFRLFKLSK